jgi:Lon protease-like protein
MIERPLTDDELSRLAIFPLPEAVLFPNAALPLPVFEPRYRKLVGDCIESKSPLAVWQFATDAAASSETPHGPALQPVATAGRIGSHVALPDGRLDIVVLGVERVRLLDEADSGEPYRIVRVARHPLDPLAGGDVSGRIETLRGLAGMLAVEHPRAARLLSLTLARCEDPEELSDVLCAITHDDSVLRQELLETSSICARLDRVVETLSALVLHAALDDDDGVRM